MIPTQEMLAKPPQGILEIPTCGVCLEKLDDSVGGVLGQVADHHPVQPHVPSDVSPAVGWPQVMMVLIRFASMFGELFWCVDVTFCSNAWYILFHFVFRVRVCCAHAQTNSSSPPPLAPCFFHLF